MSGGRHFLLVACRSPHEIGRGDGVVLRSRMAMLRRHGRVTVLAYGAGGDWPDPGVRVVGVPFSRGAALVGAAQALARGLPLQVGIWRQPAFCRAFLDLTAETRFDAAGFITLRCAFALDPELRARPALPVWLEMIDLLSENMRRIGARAPGPRRALMRFEAGRLARLERQAASRFHPVLLVNRDEAARDPGFDHLPLGLPPERFRGPAPARPVPPLRVCVSGNFTYLPNREAAELAFRGVSRFLAEGGCAVDLSLLGRGAGAMAAALGPVPAALALRSEEPEDMTAALAACDVALCPVLTFTGMQNKLLEAAAAGLIVIATPGPAAVIGLQPDQHFLPVAEAGDIARQLARVAADPPAFDPMRRAAQAAVREAHAEDRLAGQFDRLLGLGPPGAGP